MFPVVTSLLALIATARAYPRIDERASSPLVCVAVSALNAAVPAKSSMTAFCSSYLHIPLSTTTTTISTSTITAATQTSTVTAFTTSNPVVVSTVSLGCPALFVPPREKRTIAVPLPSQLAGFAPGAILSSACSCLSIAPSTTTVSTVATTVQTPLTTTTTFITITGTTVTSTTYTQLPTTTCNAITDGSFEAVPSSTSGNGGLTAGDWYAAENALFYDNSDEILDASQARIPRKADPTPYGNMFIWYDSSSGGNYINQTLSGLSVGVPHTLSYAYSIVQGNVNDCSFVATYGSQTIDTFTFSGSATQNPLPWTNYTANQFVPISSSGNFVMTLSCSSGSTIYFDNVQLNGCCVAS